MLKETCRQQEEFVWYDKMVERSLDEAMNVVVLF
jgi:hypothetical protein